MRRIAAALLVVVALIGGLTVASIPGAEGAPRREIAMRSVFGTVAADSIRNWTAWCPAGTEIITGGYRYGMDADQVSSLHVIESRPYVANDDQPAYNNATPSEAPPTPTSEGWSVTFRNLDVTSGHTATGFVRALCQ